MQIRTFATCVIFCAVCAPIATWACSSCGGALDSDWASQGYSANGGLRFESRFDYVNQNQLRQEKKIFDRGAVSVSADEEIQQSTLNRNLSVGVDYSQDARWGVNFQLPLFDRPHATLAEGDDEISRSRTRGVGDVRILGRFQGFNEAASLGIQFGLKLPTGRFDERFSTGPQTGQIVDRGLQTGSGTTDVLLGVYRFGAVTDTVDYFGSLLVQLPLNSRDQFRPGKRLLLNGGLRFQTSVGVEPQLQLNIRADNREKGINADTDNSGARLAYLGPGFTVPVGKSTQFFFFVQVPIYQQVNGLQLEPRYTVSAGWRVDL